MYLVIFLLLATCNPSTSIDIYNEDDSRYETDFQIGDVFQSVRNFFHNLKNQIHDRLFGERTTTIPALLPTEVLQLDKSELQKRLGAREWHLLDLTSLFFDPNKDWGFRIGNWYFIRKESIDESGYHSDSDESDLPYSTTAQPKTSVKVEIEKSVDTTNDVGTTESPLTTLTMEAHDVTPLITQQTDSQTTISTTEPINSSVNSSLVTNVPLLEKSENASDFLVEAP